MGFDFTYAPQIGFENLRDVEWKEGKAALLGVGPGPRHALVAIMTKFGNRKAIFADEKEHPFMAMVSIIGPDGELRTEGGHAIPVFPNGDMLMVVVRRPGLFLAEQGNQRPEFADEELGLIYEDENSSTLLALGPEDSLEFPGGSIDPEDETMSMGIRRELLEETGIPSGTKVKIIRRVDPVHLAIAEMTLSITTMAVYLPEVPFPDHVDEDGGIRVVRVSPTMFRLSKNRGLIRAATTLECWRFLQDTQNSEELALMKRFGEVIEEETTLG